MKILKYLIYFTIIVIIFAFLPESFLNKLKNFFNWENFSKIFITGLYRFLNFIKEITGLDLIPLLNKIIDFFNNYIYGAFKDKLF